MSDISRLAVAWVSAQQRHYRQSTRGIATVEQRLEWEREAEEIIAAHDAEVVACCNRVRELHKRRTEQVITGDCAAGECEHWDECPTVQFDVCVECYRVAEESDPYFWEYSLRAVAYPCPTIKAIDGRAVVAALLKVAVEQQKARKGGE